MVRCSIVASERALVIDNAGGDLLKLAGLVAAAAALGWVDVFSYRIHFCGWEFGEFCRSAKEGLDGALLRFCRWKEADCISPIEKNELAPVFLAAPPSRSRV